MKEFDLVKLENLKEEYATAGLEKGQSGVVLQILPYNKILVQFFNDAILGDFAVVEIDASDLKYQSHKLPEFILKDFKSSKKFNLDEVRKKTCFNCPPFKEFDTVELIVEKKEYAQLGLHKGCIGTIAIDYIVDNTILVDFDQLSDSGDFFDDVVRVNVADLKLIDS